MANKNEGASTKRGFASMNSEKQREIASLGGKAAHANGNAHQWNSQEAREAGRLGGKASHKSSSISEDSDAENANNATLIESNKEDLL